MAAVRGALPPWRDHQTEVSCARGARLISFADVSGVPAGCCARFLPVQALSAPSETPRYAEGCLWSRAPERSELALRCDVSTVGPQDRRLPLLLHENAARR